ncbi:hypothetical protein ACWEO4_21175 [Streptomyces sp. NPDC004393]|uniref:hypothetical protein n=1 Tax=Streptomyces sp. NPDC004533 TaxID=3154278 RepID=UPI0033A3F42C
MSRPPLLHRRFTALADSLPHLRLGRPPTPVRELTGPTSTVPVWCKDESGYGAGGWGGNKIRKLGWILPDARRQGARTDGRTGPCGRS